MGTKGIFKNIYKPHVGEGPLSPNREMVTDFVKDIFTEHPSFARTIQRKCLGRSGKMVKSLDSLSLSCLALSYVSTK